MFVLDVPRPAFMQDDEIRMFADSARRCFERAAPPERVAKWRNEGQVKWEFCRERGEAGFLSVMVPSTIACSCMEDTDISMTIRLPDSSETHELHEFMADRRKS